MVSARLLILLALATVCAPCLCGAFGCDDSRPLVSDIAAEDAGDAAPCDAAGQAGASSSCL